jgi:hypothetical protein
MLQVSEHVAYVMDITYDPRIEEVCRTCGHVVNLPYQSSQKIEVSLL